MPNKTYKCPRCGTPNEAKAKQCSSCISWLPQRYWRMTKARKAAVHMLAKRKGLINGSDKEMYQLRLSRFGLTSSVDMKQTHYKKFMKEVGGLPDAN